MTGHARPAFRIRVYVSELWRLVWHGVCIYVFLLA